jgi:hypothetical protein
MSRQGYQIYATHDCGETYASYTEAETPNEAASKCLIQFPSDRYSAHKLKNLETNGEFNVKGKSPDPDDELESLKAVANAARDFIHEGENWEAYIDSKDSNSVAWPPEFLLLAQAVEKKFGLPVQKKEEFDDKRNPHSDFCPGDACDSSNDQS